MYIVLPNAGALIFLRNPNEQMAWGHDGVGDVYKMAPFVVYHTFFFTFNWTRKDLGTPRRPLAEARVTMTIVERLSSYRLSTGYHVDFFYF